ncbi:MAG: carboxymuconolactone decarboxylase family protein [Actinomycetota bacterium]
MAFINGVTEDSATGQLAEQFAADRKSWGYLPNLATTFGIRPQVYQAWRQLNGAIKSSMDPRRYELVTVAAAVELRSSYCALAHGRVLAQGLMSDEEVIGLVTDPGSAGLAPVDRAVISLARKIVAGATDVGPEDIGALRDCGLGDEEIFDVIVAASSRCFFSKTLDATGTLPDAAFAELSPPLRDALTVGRAIDSPVDPDPVPDTLRGQREPATGG